MLTSMTILGFLNTAALLAEEGEAPATPFAGTLYQSAAAIIVFLLLLAVLRKTAWGPILKGLTDREARIKGDLEKADQAARQAEAKLKEYHATLARAHEEARKILEQSRAQAEQVAEKIQHETKAEISAARQRAEVEIRLAKEQALTDIYTHTATLATEVAGKILQRELRPEDQRALIEQSLAELKPASNN